MKYLYLLVALLATTLVALDHYTIRVYLNEVQNVEKIQTNQMLDYVMIDYANYFADRVLKISEQQSSEIATLDKQLQKATGIVKALQSELTQAYKVIEQDGETIKDLTDQNSQLRNGIEEEEFLLRQVKHNISDLEAENQKLQDLINELQEIISNYEGGPQ